MPGAATAEKLEQPKSLENIGLELLRQYQDSQVDKAANLAIKILVPGAVAVGVVATALHLIANPPDAPIYQSKEFRSIGNYAGATTLLAMISVGVSKGVAYVLNRSRNSNNDEDDVRYAPIHSDISAHFDEFGGFTQGSSGMNEEDHVDDVLSDTVAQDAFRLLSPDHKDAVLLDMLHYRLSMGETDSIDTFRNYIEHRNQGAVDLLVQKVIDGCQDDQLPQYHDLLQGKQVTRAIDHYLSTNDTQSAWRIVGCNMPITNNKLVYVVEIIDQFIEQGSYDGAYNILMNYDRILPSVYKRNQDGTFDRDTQITTCDLLERITDGFIKEGNLLNAVSLTTCKLFRKVMPYDERKKYRQTLFDHSETSPMREQVRAKLYKEAI